MGCSFHMKSLPFVVKPKKVFSKVQLGNESIGIFEIEKRGYLTVSEKSFVDSVMQGSDAVTLIVALATRIGSKTNHTIEDTYKAIIAAIQGGDIDAYAERIKEDYQAELADIVGQMGDSVQRRALAAATVMIKSRVDPEWTVEDTLEQHPDMINIISEFYGEEELGDVVSKEDVAPTEESIEETVGKSEEANGAA